MSASKPEKHKQVKVLVDTEVANAFKAACAKQGISMAGELSRFMAEYTKTVIKREKPNTYEDASTRKKRRQMINHVIRLMELARDGEDAYRWNIPPNLQNSIVYELSEESSSVMEEIIDQLGAVY
jgi:hypothetical protein